MSAIIYRPAMTGCGAFTTGRAYRIAPHSDYWIRGATRALVVGFGNTRLPNSDGHHMPFARVVLSNGLGEITPRKRRWIALDDLGDEVRL